MREPLSLSLHIKRSFSHFLSQVEHNASFYQYVFVSLTKHGANTRKYFQYSKEKGQKLTLLWFSGLLQYAFGDYSTWEKGERYGQTGSEAACNIPSGMNWMSVSVMVLSIRWRM